MRAKDQVNKEEVPITEFVFSLFFFHKLTILYLPLGNTKFWIILIIIYLLHSQSTLWVLCFGTTPKAHYSLKSLKA
jgi:hypothetical protein